MPAIIGSARIGENNKTTGGSPGDQKQKSSTNDTAGEVSMQSFYVHSKGWYIFRPKSIEVAEKIAAAMKTACNNANVGYNQSSRNGIIKYGTASKTKTDCDCSSLVRQCIKEATGKDVGNFTTATESAVLVKSGLFGAKIEYNSGTTLKTGDILVTKTKGHTAVVVSGEETVSGTDYTKDGVDYSYVFDASYYADKYPDLAINGCKTKTQLFNHFLTYGMKEKRQAIATFNVTAYAGYYADLRTAFGSDWPSYYKHYCTIGHIDHQKCV